MSEQSDPAEAARIRRNRLVGRTILVIVGLIAAVQIGVAIWPRH